MVDSVSETADRRKGWLPADEVVRRLNRNLTGWVVGRSISASARQVLRTI